jgi:hypothetical protein
VPVQTSISTSPRIRRSCAKETQSTTSDDPRGDRRRERASACGACPPAYLIEAPILFTGIKYAANSFVAMKLTFINEMADICERVGADVHDVARGIGLDGRIGRKFLHPGPGFGGSCFPTDTLALVRIAQEYGARPAGSAFHA